VTFEVQLSPSGKTFLVEEGLSILNAGLAAGIKMPYGCRIGTCRSCRGKVVDGKVDFGAAHPAYLPQHQRDEGYALLCQASACSNLRIELEELPQLSPPQIAPAYVKKVEFLSDDVAAVMLRLPLHLNLQFESGQYVDFIFPDGLRRSYSIANPSAAAGTIDLEFHIRHLPGGLFTDKLFQGLKPREKLQFEGPLGSFFLRESPKPALFLASGTGYAPIRSILLKHLAMNRKRQLTLYWGGRSRKDLYMLEEARDLAAQYSNFHFVPVLSEPRAADEWTGATGFVHMAVMRDLSDLSGWQVYACGTPLMVEAATRDFTAKCGLPEAEFFSDSFVSMADMARNGSI
jgi:CDP-4-dehydro-6-deoxyglucose reductase, E3